jgi:hypothetical protein
MAVIFLLCRCVDQANRGDLLDLFELVRFVSMLIKVVTAELAVSALHAVSLSFKFSGLNDPRRRD